MLLELAWKSLHERRGGVSLTLAALTLCVVMLLGVEHLRSQAREVFTRSVSGADLIVGARTSQLNLLLYSVFRIGAPANNVSLESYEYWLDDERVAWGIPFSLGDSHRGYAVLATDQNYFAHFRYGTRQTLSFAEGRAFLGVHDAVLGFEVARALGYTLGTELVLSHGVVEISFANHDESPFQVTGILAPTGTPADQAVYISLEAQAVLHEQEASAADDATAGAQDHDDEHGHAEPALTAFLLGLDTRGAVFGLQREINEYAAEPLTAILPGVALTELWQSLGKAETLLALLSGVVMLASLLGLATMLLASMQARRREIALYRALGARPWMILALIELEALLMAAMACALGYGVVVVALSLGQQTLLADYGIAITVWPFTPLIGIYLLAIVTCALLLSLIPAISAYRSALSTELGRGR